LRLEKKGMMGDASEGGYILANTDVILEGARLDVVKAMVDTARIYGRY